MLSLIIILLIIMGNCLHLRKSQKRGGSRPSVPTVRNNKYDVRFHLIIRRLFLSKIVKDLGNRYFQKGQLDIAKAFYLKSIVRDV